MPLSHLLYKGFMATWIPGPKPVDDIVDDAKVAAGLRVDIPREAADELL